MRELLKYAFVLAVGAAIGAYIVLSLEDRRARREATAADFEPAPPATANAERLPLAEKAPRSRGAVAPGDESREQAHFSCLASLS